MCGSRSRRTPTSLNDTDLLAPSEARGRSTLEFVSTVISRSPPFITAVTGPFKGGPGTTGW
jgi:hypothetical protein